VLAAAFAGAADLSPVEEPEVEEPVEEPEVEELEGKVLDEPAPDLARESVR
jgi:hypothetical protein